MLLDANTISTLQKLGLTLYGAKAYAALVSTGTTTATVLARAAEVPPTKIYETMKRLEEERWVTVEKGRPNLYTPRYPKEVIEERRSMLYSEIDKVSNQLTMIYDQLIERESPRVWVIKGAENIVSKTIEMMGRAKHHISIMGALFSSQELKALQKHIQMARKRGVSVRVITQHTVTTSQGDLEIVKLLQPVTADIRVLPNAPYLRTLIIDDRELLWVYSRVEDGIADLTDMVGIWISDTSTSSFLLSDFNNFWDRCDSP
jgi:sugar-specific transcriptional regulator TrmB